MTIFRRFRALIAALVAAVMGLIPGAAAPAPAVPSAPPTSATVGTVGTECNPVGSVSDTWIAGLANPATTPRTRPEPLTAVVYQMPDGQLVTVTVTTAPLVAGYIVDRGEAVQVCHEIHTP